jgi:hypothetical protein
MRPRAGRIGGFSDEGKGAVVGALVLNRFEVRDRLGSGGFGTVYRAFDQRLEREVAVKVIDLGGQSIDRVLREAQAVGRLNHRSVVTLYELGEDGRRAYLVSELVEGSTLAEMQRQRALSDRDVGNMAIDVCEALEHAHSRGVVHRDIKPQNVQVAASEGRAKLMDFGIARVLDEVGLTATGDIVGTLAYMAPEQAEGETVGPPADVYSLALTLYEAWSGENPNARVTPAATARAIGEPVAPLAELRGDLPDGLCDTLDDCLEADPELRPPCSELREAVEDAMPELQFDGSVPKPHARHVRLGAAIEAVAAHGPLGLLSAGAVAVLTLAAMAATPSGGPSWIYFLPFLSGAVALLWPRLGYLLGVAGLIAWLATTADLPGAAFVIGLLAIPPGILLGPASRGAPLPAVAPLLGLASVAPVYPALAGLAGRARDRFLLGACGYLWLAVAESAWDRKLLFGPQHVAEHGWQSSIGAATAHLLLPLAAKPAFWFGIALWSLGALALGVVVRGRSAALDLIGATVWVAALVAALRLYGGAASPSPAALGISVLVVVSIAIAWRARVGTDRVTSPFGRPAAAMPDGGREATLS